jgi:hypothetical protein
MTSFRVDKNSDHWPFFERGVPAFFTLSAADYSHYHQPTDDVERLDPESMEAVARAVGEMVVRLASVPEPLADPKTLARYLLRETPRVVEPVGTRALLDQFLSLGSVDSIAGAPSPFAEAGIACAVRPIDDRSPGGVPVAWAALTDGVRIAGRGWGVLRGAADLANATRGARTLVLPRLSCATSVALRPAVLSVYRGMGFLWVEPFEEGKAPAAEVRDAILGAGVAAKVVVDLTALPGADRVAARARLVEAPATVRTQDAAGLAALRKALGPKTLVLVSGPAADAVLTLESLAAADDPALAPVCVVDDDTERLVNLLAAAAAGDGHPALSEPNTKERARLRSLLGGAFVNLLRRL